MDAKTIVLLERDPDVAATVRTMLETEGHRVIVADSPAAVLAEVSKRAIDVVLTNRVHATYEFGGSLPWMIRTMQPDTAIVLTTRWSGDPHELAPVDVVLPKPFSILDLREVIAAVTRPR